MTSSSNDNIYPTIFVDQLAKAHIVYVAMEPGDAEIFYADNVAGIWNIGRVTDNSVDDWAVFGRYFVCDRQSIGHIVFWNNSDGDHEIYHAYSNGPLYAGISEKPYTPSSSPSLAVAPILAANSTVSYSVPVSGSVSLKVYDASGSLVKTLVSGTSAAGEFSVSWNGITDSGTKATGGVYFFRLVTGSGSASARTILK